MTTLIYTLFAFVSIGLIGTHWSFSRLIEIEYLHFHDEWVADGKPIGGKAPRKEATFLSNSLPRELFYRWVGRKPSWVNQSIEAEFWYKHLRFWGYWFAISFLCFITVIIIVVRSLP